MAFRKIIRYWAYFLFIIGGMGFGGGYVASYGFLDGIIHEFPLAPTGIVVDYQENIYVALGFYGMVQVYNKNGRFKTSFRIPNTKGGAFRMRLQADGNLSVAVQKTNTIYQFNTDGELIEIIENQILQYEKFPKNQVVFWDATTKYNISSAIFYPEILREKNGISEPVVVIPDHLKPFKGAFPAWLFWVLGVILLALSTGDLAQKLFRTQPAQVEIKQTKTQTQITITQSSEGHFAETTLLVFFTALWIYGGYLMLNEAFLRDFSPLRTVFYAVIGLLWILGLRQIVVGILWLLSGKEVILIHANQLKISQEALFLRQTKSFPIEAVYDILGDDITLKNTAKFAKGIGRGRISFRHQKRQYRFGKNLIDKDLKLVLAALKKSKSLKSDKFKPQRKSSFVRQFLKYMANPKD